MDQTAEPDEAAIAPPHIPLHELLGLEFVEMPEGVEYSEIRMPVRPEAFGFTGNLHGGAIATLVDLACAVAAVKATSFDVNKESMVTSDMHLRYVGRPRTANVIARAEVVRVGSQLIVIDVKVIDENEHLVAVGDLSMMRVTLRDPLDV